MSHKRAVISKPRVKGISFGKDANSIEFSLAENLDLGQ